MPTVSYTTLNGVIVSEDRAGVKRDYISDSLGSTIALVDDTQTQTDAFFYWPFGEIRTQTGTSKTPFTFVGTLGYYMDIASSLYYVRMRHLRSLVARWLTVDPVWPLQGSYDYAKSSPVYRRDPSGMFPCSYCSVLAPLLGILGYLACCEVCDGDCGSLGGGGGTDSTTGDCQGACADACNWLLHRDRGQFRDWQSACHSCCYYMYSLSPPEEDKCYKTYCVRKKGQPFRLPCKCID